MVFVVFQPLNLIFYIHISIWHPTKNNQQPHTRRNKKGGRKKIILASSSHNSLGIPNSNLMCSFDVKMSCVLLFFFSQLLFLLGITLHRIYRTKEN
jgi:hypothetical protein